MRRGASQVLREESEESGQWALGSVGSGQWAVEEVGNGAYGDYGTYIFFGVGLETTKARWCGPLFVVGLLLLSAGRAFPSRLGAASGCGRQRVRGCRLLRGL